MKNKEILITGGTGSLGKALTNALIPLKPKGIRIFSRSELNQFNMKQQFKDYDVPISYIIGDIRDRDRLIMALKGVDYVVNTAAMKRIEVCESDPLECIKTNVDGVSNLVYAALRNNVQKVLQVSTDKAVYPTTLYGASKKCAEDLIINANVYSEGISRWPYFMAVRYGNVLGSNGSVLGIFLKQIAESKKLTVTNEDMTRFWITLPNVCQFIVSTLQNHTGGIHIPKMTSSSIKDLLCALRNYYKLQKLDYVIIPTQVNEKKHESLTTIEESERIVYSEERFIINSSKTEDNKAPLNWTYTSDNTYAGSAVTVKFLTKMINEIINDN
jgi:UDP-N-acetylglucosamine 4,6-dehydratase